MKLIIDISDEEYETLSKMPEKEKVNELSYYERLIANGTPYNPTGDLISREALKEEIDKKALDLANGGMIFVESINRIIDNAPTMPLPNEQIAWEQGYEAGLAQGKHDKKGEWTTDVNGYFYCDRCGRYPHDQYATTDFCPKCGADMRKDGAE